MLEPRFVIQLPYDLSPAEVDEIKRRWDEEMGRSLADAEPKLIRIVREIRRKRIPLWMRIIQTWPVFAPLRYKR